MWEKDNLLNLEFIVYQILVLYSSWFNRNVFMACPLVVIMWNNGLELA